jgi:hypothetical protein
MAGTVVEADGAVLGQGVAIIIRSMHDDLPGADLIAQGLGDLGAGAETEAALLVSIGAPRLRQLGLEVVDPIPGGEHRLYELLSRTDPDSAHSRYNALVRRLVSFERALACAR